MSHAMGIESLIEMFKQQRLESAVGISAVMSSGLSRSVSTLKEHTEALSGKMSGYQGDEMEIILLELDKISRQLEMFQWDRRNIHAVTTGDVNLSEFVSQVFSSLHDRAVRAKVSFLLDVPSQLVVKTDTFRLAQVLMALFENSLQALEKSQNRPRWIQVSLHEGLNQNNEFIFTLVIGDNGCGIHDDHPERIFDLFYSTNTDSCALSLHVARELSHEMGGELRLANTGVMGTTFELALHSN